MSTRPTFGAATRASHRSSGWVWVLSRYCSPSAISSAVELITLHFKETNKGALVGQINERDLSMEIWRLDSPENRPFVGPCTDTDDDAVLLGTGTTSYIGHDTNVFGPGTRGNTFGDQGQAMISGDEGAFSYTWKFHVSYRCHAPDDGPPACFMDRAVLAAR